MEREKKWRPACYCRVSTIHQVDKESIPSQVHMLSKYCEGMLGCEKDDVEFYIDRGRSGKDTNRPQYQKMMDDIAKGKRNIVLAYKLDRVSRNLIDFAKFLETLQKSGAEFISLTEAFDTSSVMGRGMLKLVALFAEMERGITRERVMAVSKDIITRGGHLGAPTPLGYDRDEENKTFKINEQEAQTVRWIFNTALERKSTHYMACKLNDDKIPGKRGGLWTSTTIFHILHNPAYKGLYVWNRASGGTRKQKAKSEWMYQDDVYPVIIPPEKWQATQDVLASRRRGKASVRSHTEHLFANIITCGECGHSMRYRADRKRGDGVPITIYHCANYALHRGCHNNKYASDVTLAPFIIQYIANMNKLSYSITSIETPAQLERVLLFRLPEGTHLANLSTLFGLYCRANDDTIPATVAMTKAAALKETMEQDKELEKYYRALDKLKDLYLYGESDMSKEDYVKTRAGIEAKIAAASQVKEQVQSRISPSLNVDKEKYLPVLRVLNVYMDWKRIILETSQQLASEFCHDVLKQVIIDKGRIIKIVFNNDVQHVFTYD